MAQPKRGPALYALLFLASLALLIWLFFRESLNQVPPVSETSPADEDTLWIDLNLQPSLVAWFNHAARPQDMARADQPHQVGWLDEVTVGKKVIIFKSAATAEQVIPRIADKVQVLGYNLEHGPLNPIEEQADPIGSVVRMRALADRYGMLLAIGPDHDFALSHGSALAAHADIFVMQVQRVQTEPEVVAGFVLPLVKQVRQANSQIQISVQVRSEGDVDALAALIRSLQDNLDGVSILTSQETTETAKALVEALRPSKAAPTPD